MNRRLVLGGAGVVIALSLAAASAPTSQAVGSGTGASSSAAAHTGTVSSITPAVKVCPLSLLGLLGTCSTGPLASVTGLLGSLLTPVTTLVGAVQTVPSGLVTAVTGAGLSASQPTTQVSRPNPQNDPATGLPNLPTCGQQGWDPSGAGDCYTGLPLTIPTSALLGLNVTGIGGYATDDSTGYIGAALAAGVTLSLLGSPVGTVGTVSSSAQCSNDAGAPACAATNSAVKASLLPTTASPSGALAVSIASGGATPVATIGGAALSPTNNTVLVPGLGNVKAGLSNQLLTLTITLSTSQLTALLPSLAGLSGLVSDTGTVTIGIGPGSTSSVNGTATSSGLVISADLSLDIKLSVLGLATVEITTGSGITNPDLLNLGLAYSSATAGTPQASWIGPSLI